MAESHVWAAEWVGYGILPRAYRKQTVCYPSVIDVLHFLRSKSESGEWGKLRAFRSTRAYSVS